MGVGNSTTPSIMFMLEPAVATVSICLPAISALATRGLKHMPTSYFRNTWSKKPSSSRSTIRASAKLVNPTLKPFPRQVSRRNTDDSKNQQLLPIACRNSIDEKDDVNRSAGDDIKTPEPMNAAVDRTSSTFLPAKVKDEKLLSKLLELERRVRRYYQRSEFPHGPHDTPNLDNTRTWRRENPLLAPSKDNIDPAQC